MADQDLEHLVTRIPGSKESRAGRIKKLTQLGHAEYQPWATKALKARRYYQGHQWDDMSTVMARRRLRLTDNVIRDDIDKKVARLLEADPVMETHGRGAEDFQLGVVWRDLIQYADEWSGDHYDSAKMIRSLAWTETHVTGDAFEWITWVKGEEKGLGMVVSEFWPAFNVVWDDESRSTQLRDARWVTRFAPRDIEVLEQKYSAYRGRIKSDVPGLFASGYEQARGEHYETTVHPSSGGISPADMRRSRAYELECWEKRKSKRTVFLLDGRPAMTRDAKGNPIRLTEAMFERLPLAQQRRYEEVADDNYHELWRTVVVNDWVVEEALSDYDESKGGHGQYPLARYAATRHPDQTHARGEVEPLMGHQDVMNQTMSYGLERLFLDSSSLLAITRGAQPKSEEAKLDRIGEVALQKFYMYPGQQVPQAVALGSPQGPQLFQAFHNWLQERKDKQSQVTDVHRAAPQYEMSGRAIRALMAEADLSQSKMRVAIEDGLRQATFLRIALMQQYMRANRMIRISPKAEEPAYNLYVTRNREQLQTSQRLQAPEGVAGADYLENPDGERARVLELSDAEIRQFDLRLKLDTGKERNKAERMDLVTQILGYVGPAAGIEVVLWAAELLEVPNLDRLAEALQQEDAKTKLMQMVDEIQQQTGMPIQQLAQVAQAAMTAGGGAMAMAGGAPASPASPAPEPPGPGGAPSAPPATPASPNGAPNGEAERAAMAALAGA